MKRFTIDRLTWLRGEGNENSALLRSTDGKMCCLGQIGAQSGILQQDLCDRSTPMDFSYIRTVEEEDGEGRQRIMKAGEFFLELGLTKENPDSTFYTSKDSDFAGKAMQINDDETITDEQREYQLTELFAENNIELTFIN